MNAPLGHTHELSAAPAGSQDGHAAGRAGLLGMIELLDRDGGVAHRIAVHHWPVTIGRAIDCDVVLDDPHVAPHHATIERPDAAAAPQLKVGESLNGARLRGARLAAGDRATLTPGAEWQLGRTRLRLRLVGEVLAREELLSTVPPGRGRRAALGMIVLALWLIATQWLQSDPGDPLAGYLPALVTVPAALGIWSFVWALGSKLFSRHFDFVAHLQLALAALLLSMLLDALLPLAAFALSWEWLTRAVEMLTLAIGCALVWAHLSLILPAHRHALAVGFATMFVVGTGLKLALNQQRTDRWFGQVYLSALGPPGLRVAPAVTPQRFLQEARALRAPLEQRAREDGPAGWLEGDDAE
jgi:pSer/pThr/pTyr-binding forkhead associated (FHA) protein